jgi:porin
MMSSYAAIALLAQQSPLASVEMERPCPPPDDPEASIACQTTASQSEAKPVQIEIAYTGEIMAVTAGGRRTGARYLDNLDVTITSDMEQVAGWNGTTIFLYGLYNNGTSISNLAGDAFAVSNIETGVQAARLYEAWVEKKFESGLSLKAGLYDLNSEFDSLESSGLFVGSAHGIGTDISQAGLNGPSIFPLTSLAFRIEQELSSAFTVRAALLDGVPGDPDDLGATAIRLSREDGVLGIAELDLSFDDARLLLGHWRYSADFDDFDGTEDNGNSGTYLRGEAPLASGSGIETRGFFRLGVASGRFNPFSTFASAGLNFTSLLAEDDEMGLAVAHGWTSDEFRAATGAGRGETVLELTWRKSVLPFFSIQPSVQYVINPSADPAIENAVVLGLRTVTNVSF